VILLEKNAFLGGNSTKATSGINGAGTAAQAALGIADTTAIFEKDTLESARELARPELIRVLCEESGPAVAWLQARFALDLSKVSRLGGHSQPRTHRGEGGVFPGMMITYALMEAAEAEASKPNPALRIVTKATVTSLITDSAGQIAGVRYRLRGATSDVEERGVVVIASGGYAADFGPDGLLAQYRPDVLHLSTTNGEHATGDGIKMAVRDAGAGLTDPKQVQVHPTGLVDPKDPKAKVRFLAAEALRGCGGLLLDAGGERFCNELGHRDYVSEQMFKRAKEQGRQDPYYFLVLNGGSSREIEWHCKHYSGRGLMRHYKSGREFAEAEGVPLAALERTFAAFNKAEKTGDSQGRKYFKNMPWVTNDEFYVATVTPVVHYCMGGLATAPDASVLRADGTTTGAFVAGEACGGVHGANRLGGSSLLDCVVYGRVAGASAARSLLQAAAAGGAGAAGAGGAGAFSVQVDPAAQRVTIDWSGSSSSSASTTASPAAATSAAAAAEPAAAAAPEQKEYTMAEVAKHSTEDDCWVVVNGQVLDVTKFLPDHPGGKRAVLLFAGKDATSEFNMLHDPNVVAKYAPETVIGTLKDASPGGKAKL
jgi:flavocytochrome c